MAILRTICSQLPDVLALVAVLLQGACMRTYDAGGRLDGGVPDGGVHEGGVPDRGLHEGSFHESGVPDLVHPDSVPHDAATETVDQSIPPDATTVKDCAKDAAPPEVCNGLDDDNDGAIDEGGVCPLFCIGRTWSSHVYFFCAHLETYAAARTCCTGFGMKLARVNSATEEQWLISEGKSLWGTPANVWLGGTDAALEGTWRWEDGAVFYAAAKPVLYCAWNSGQPSNGANEDCLAICTGTGWNDIDCSTKTVHVCEKY